MGDGPYPNIVQVYGYGISAKASDAKLAWSFLQELTSPYTKAGQEWAKHNLAVSRPVAASSGQEVDPLYAPFLAVMDSARLGAFDRSSMRLWKYWNNDLLRDWIVRGGIIHLEKKLAEIAREYDREYDKAGSTTNE
jgi:ABC-type glycerol-3-phosphate transport system substrate-binding protein